MSLPTWTPQQDAELIRLRHEGFSYSEIGRAFGVTRHAAICRAHRLQRAGVEFPATAAKPRAVTQPKPQAIRASRVPRAPRPIATPKENTGLGLWDRSPEAQRKAWRVVEGDVWQALDGSEPVALVGRAPCQCAWPVDGQGDEFMACGEPVQTGSSYCGAHHRMAWIPRKTPHRRFARHVERLAARC